MEEKRGLTIKDLLIRLILIIIFIFLLIWLFPMPDLKPLNNQIFADNVDRMKDVAKSYYTVERLPKNINDYKRMTLKEMIDNKLILPLMDSNGKYCSEGDSYIEITKLENEYVIKVYLSCSDKQDYIIEHFGCYDICSDTCKMLETTTTNVGIKKTSKYKVTTTKNSGKIYEYQFVRNNCTNNFDKYVCPSGYYLVGDSCIKDGSKTVTVAADKHISNVSSTDTKDAKAVITSSTQTTDASCKNETTTSTIDATSKTSTYDAIASTSNQTVSANKVNSYDVKGSVATVTRTDVNYITVQNYSVISADKIITSYGWSYDYTKISTDSGLAYTAANDKLEYVESWSEATCSTCASMKVYYKYYHYVKTAASASYSCAAYSGYSLYDGNKCRKATTVSKACPSGYTANGSVCSKSVTTYSCSKYGSDYKFDSSNKTCVKTTTSYKCPSGTSATSDPKYCNKKVTTYSCPSGTTSIGNNKCSKTEYSCPSNTSSKIYTLLGNKCTVKTTSKVCTCPSGTVQSSDKTKCVKTNSHTTYSCSDYPGYTLNGSKCTKTTTTQKVTYSCDSGYILNNTSCVKTVHTSDSKKADKSYKTVCNPQYKWSTNLSINGWSYTGNKRSIN